MRPADLDRFAVLGSSGRELLRKAASELGLSARAYHKIMNIARSIADLAGADPIGEAHVAEAIQFRSIDRSFVKY
jgi:magnesium chelatase family protein